MADKSTTELKQRMRAVWTAGDFGKIAEQNTKQAEEFVARLRIQPGMRVLDVACGSGNVALPAAALGARVVGVDIAPNLLEQARTRAKEAKLDIRFDEGDAEELPYEDGAFDLVTSMYGAMFAPHPEKVAVELARVCKAGGTIAMANWTPESFPALMFRVASRHAPPPPGLLPPVLWGDDKTARERLGPYVSEIHTERRIVWFESPLPPPAMVSLFRQYFGPMSYAFERMHPAAQTAYQADLEKLWTEQNQARDGGTSIRGECLEVIAKRA